MTRREFSARTKVAAYERSGGSCERCGARLTVGKFHYDHNTPDGLNGEPTLENCVVLCIACHSDKTRKKDVPAIAKAKRREASHLGAKKSKRPMPGSRQSLWKRKLDGTWVRRGER